ncbi:hypothetical protein EW145_g8221, partial [Phellinidium pouzarii]
SGRCIQHGSSVWLPIATLGLAAEWVHLKSLGFEIGKQQHNCFPRPATCHWCCVHGDFAVNLLRCPLHTLDLLDRSPTGQLAAMALDNTLGMLYIASILTMGLWGAGTVQMYYYFTKYTKDETWLKIHVFVVWAFDTAHQALIIKANYIYLITQYGNPAFLVHVESSLLNSIILTAFICAGVQIIFLMRIWRLSKRNIYMTGVVALLVAAQFVSTVVYYGKAYHFQTFADLETIFTITRIINVLTAASDIVVAAALVYLLQTSRTGFKASDTIISRLIAFTVNTGLITAMCAIASLVTGITYPNTLIYILFYLSLGRCEPHSIPR